MRNIMENLRQDSEELQDKSRSSVTTDGVGESWCRDPFGTHDSNLVSLLTFIVFVDVGRFI
jgi:hypothetical protein